MPTPENPPEKRVSACTALEPLSPPGPDGTPTHRFLTTEDAARYLQFGSVLAFRRWAKRQGVKGLRLGPRTQRWDRRELEQRLGVATDPPAQETQHHADPPK